MSEALETWELVKKYLNKQHHTIVKDNVEVETIEGKPIDAVEKELIYAKYCHEIEQEYGIDLLILFALIDTNKLYAYGHSGKIEVSNFGVSMIDKSIRLYNGTCAYTYSLSDYGKSFALTREELK